MNKTRISSVLFAVVIFSLFFTGCAEKNPAPLQVEKLAEFSDSRGQANVRLYVYSGEVEVEDIKAYSEKMGCNMLYAYFYPDTVPIGEIPVEEVREAKSFPEVNEILYQREGYARWRFASRCFTMIPVVTDCYESRVGQDCR